MKETLASIAQRTGVSITTVSRILSGKSAKYRISPKTAELVKAEAKRCKYSSKHIAQHLRSNLTHSIGLLVPSLSNQYFAEMASVLITEASKRKYNVIIIDTMEDEAVLRRGITTLIEKKVDGMVVVPCGDDPMWLEQIDRTLLPVVLIDRYYENSPLSYVITNNYQGGLMATNHLLGMGHRQIACIQGIMSSMPNAERVAGYKSAMEQAKAADHILVVGNEFTIQNGYTETKLLLSKGYRPTAIFALSSNVLLGVMKALREAGLRIPDDVSLISFDNYFYLDFMEPPISRISQPVEDMGSLAIKILFEKINHERNTNSQLRLSPTLIEGKSVIITQNSI